MQGTDDVTVSASIQWNLTGTGAIPADPRVNGPGSSSGSLVMTGQDWQPQAQATITGTFSGRTIVASMWRSVTRRAMRSPEARCQLEPGYLRFVVPVIARRAH
jgi:hypothetical protein